MEWVDYGYAGMFFSAFLAATILPFSSEFLFLFLLSQDFNPLILLFMATAGNTLGGYTTYGVGRLGNPLWLRRFGFQSDKVEAFKERCRKYGYWLGLLSWLPFVGDVLVVFMGYFRIPFLLSALTILAGKFLRYLTIYWLYLHR
jgi:membrane protein YqaA with SNARE-associated domain